MEYPKFSTQYFSNSEPFTTQPSTSVAQSKPNANPITKKKRGNNFTIEEDMLLVASWLNTSLDVVQGNDQKHKTYWYRVWEYFHKYKKFESDRDEKSLMQRWSKIQRLTNKFCGYLSQIENRHPSGVNQQDKILEANFFYEEMNNHKFGFDHCWNMLRFHPKWLNLVENENKKPTPNSSHGMPSQSPQTPINLNEDGDGNTSYVDLERPMGKKSEKRKHIEQAREPVKTQFQLLYEKVQEEKKNKGWKKKLVEEQKMELWKKSLEQNDKKFEADQKREDERIILLDTNEMPPHLVEYYRRRQQEILGREFSFN